MGRGALLVLEGCDRVGKSTQTKKLIEALNNLGFKAQFRSFPERKTLIGSVINEFLTFKKDLPAEAVHLLFSANRWECTKEMIDTLNSGVTLVVDRYAGSGAAYSAASTGRSISWCQTPDEGLPKPDLVAFLDLDKDKLSTRTGWAAERFEKEEFQQKVHQNFQKLMDNSWVSIDADDSVDNVHSKILEEALKIIKNVESLPIKKLYQT